MNRNTYEDKQIFLVIEHEEWTGERIEFMGLKIISLHEYSSYCSNSFPKILRCATSKTTLKRWLRSYKYKEIQK